MTCYSKPIVEPGACNLFLATSARYPTSMGQDAVAGVPADSIATGTDTEVVGGVYTINVDAEAEGVGVSRLLAMKMAALQRSCGDIRSGIRRLSGPHLAVQFSNITPIVGYR